MAGLQSALYKCSKITTHPGLDNVHHVITHSLLQQVIRQLKGTHGVAGVIVLAAKSSATFSKISKVFIINVFLFQVIILFQTHLILFYFSVSSCYFILNFILLKFSKSEASNFGLLRPLVQLHKSRKIIQKSLSTTNPSLLYCCLIFNCCYCCWCRCCCCFCCCYCCWRRCCCCCCCCCCYIKGSLL